MGRGMVEEMEAWWKEQDRQDRRVMRVHVALPGGSDGKASDCDVGDLGLIPGSGRIPWGRKWQPAPVLLPRKSHGRRSLVQATVHGVAKSRTRLSDFTSLHFSTVSEGRVSRLM